MLPGVGGAPGGCLTVVHAVAAAHKAAPRTAYRKRCKELFRNVTDRTSTLPFYAAPISELPALLSIEKHAEIRVSGRVTGRPANHPAPRPVRAGATGTGRGMSAVRGCERVSACESLP